MVKAKLSHQSLNNVYMPDEETVLMEPVSETVSDEEETGESTIPLKKEINLRVLRALNQRRQELVDKNLTSEMPAVRLPDEEETEEVPKPINRINHAQTNPFSEDYINERLNRSICEAQDSKNYNEAIRLQTLMFQMQDSELSPIEVAREAWLRPTLKS